MPIQLPIAPTSLDRLDDHPWDLVFCSPESSDATRAVHLDSPYRARHDIKALDWDTTHRSWDPDVELWELDFDSIGVAAAHLDSTGYDVAITYDVAHAVVAAYTDRDFFAGWLRRDDAWIRIAPPFRPVVNHFSETDGSELPRHIFDLGIITDQLMACKLNLAVPAAPLDPSTTEIVLQDVPTNGLAKRRRKLLRTVAGDGGLLIKERDHPTEDIVMIMRLLKDLSEELSDARKQKVGSYCEQAGLTVAASVKEPDTDSEADEPNETGRESEIHKIKRKLSYGSI